jgi:hypothetical protein
VLIILVFVSGDRHEEVAGCWLCRSRQSSVLQTQHVHAARRCQEDMRRSPDQDQGALPRLIKLCNAYCF